MNSKEILTPYFIRSLPAHSPVYNSRLEEEFKLIDRNNFTKVFIQVRTILELSKDIPHIIRGSAGSSLICYLMGITHIDPIMNGIELARFMNTARTDIPDIDIDVPYNFREEIFNRISEKYPKMVARISNHIMYRHKTAIRQALREEGIKQPPKHFTLDKLITDKSKKYKIESRAKQILGTKRAISKHCGGIVIFEEEQAIPQSIIYKPATDTSIGQIILNKDETEDAGYIKIDILSNRGLGQLEELSDCSLLDYPNRDLRTECLLARGDNIGITHAESRGMRKILISMAPRSLKEVAIALALIRPAAAANGHKSDFLQLWNSRLKIEDPLRKPIIFDDDAISVIRTALNCSSAEADVWRKAFAKQNIPKIYEFKRDLLKSGHKADYINDIVDDLNQLAQYSFCKSHAMSYAQLVWALAYWKANEPHNFWVATLNHCSSEFRPWVHKREAKCSGLLLTRSLPPYRLGTINNRPAVISIDSGIQTVLLSDNDPKQIISDMKAYHTWFGERFLDNCHITKHQKTLDDKIVASFTGIIAVGRVVRTDPAHPVTLITIGVENRRYIDLIVKGDNKYLLGHTGVSGQGLYKKKGFEESIEVTKIKGESLSRLCQ
jgi:error-prone DNA polymerase